MKVTKVKIRNNILKMAYCFESDEEIVKELDGGALDFFITDLKTAENDRYHLNISKTSNTPGKTRLINFFNFAIVSKVV